jgi:hypothetical protein
VSTLLYKKGGFVKVRIELTNVTCKDNEDLTGADGLFVTGGVSDSQTANCRFVLTNPLWIKGGQTRNFSEAVAEENRILFDADVPVGTTVGLSLRAYDEDNEFTLGQYVEWRQKVEQEMAGLPDVPTIEPTQYAREILHLADTVLPILNMIGGDDNDLLGEHSNSIVVDRVQQAEIPWTFSHKGRFGWSSWDYTVRYLVSVT